MTIKVSAGTWTPAFQNVLSSSGLSRYSPMKKVAKVPPIASHTRTPQQPRRFRVEPIILSSAFPKLKFLTCHLLWWFTEQLMSPGSSHTSYKARVTTTAGCYCTRLALESKEISTWGIRTELAWLIIHWKLGKPKTKLKINYLTELGMCSTVSHHISFFIQLYYILHPYYVDYIHKQDDEDHVYSRAHWALEFSLKNIMITCQRHVGAM